MIKLKCNACDGACEDEIDVRFGNACDNNCPFCFNRNLGRRPQKFDLEAIKTTIKKELPRKGLNIVGGEPLLSNNLLDLLDFVSWARYFFEEISIITSLPEIKPQDYDTFLKIMDLTDNLIVSIQHYEFEKNNDLMQASNKYNRIKFLSDLANSRYSAKLCVTLNIMRGGIDSEGKLARALRLFDSMNIKYVRINELGATPFRIQLRDVEPNFKYKSPYAHGCSINATKYFTKKLKLKNIKTVKVRIRCFIVEDDAVGGKVDLLKAKIQARSLKKAIKKNKPYKYGRYRNTVVYEDGFADIHWGKENKDGKEIV